MAQTFIWKHAPGASGSIDFKIREAKFGDGYVQTVKDGINNVRQTWPLVFNGNLADMQPIYDFLCEHGGAVSFLWTAPGTNSAALWRSPKFTMTSVGGGIYSVSAELVRSYQP